MFDFGTPTGVSPMGILSGLRTIKEGPELTKDSKPTCRFAFGGNLAGWITTNS
jgi:hypothetical protein